MDRDMITEEMFKKIQDGEFERPPEQSWRERLVEEYLYLDGKLGRLHRFIEWSPEFAKLDDHRKRMLIRQLDAMKEYHTVLGERAREEGVWSEITNILQ